jgi:hypothetical protein
MATHIRPTSIFAAILLGGAAIAQAADNSATTQIYQQRDADGHAVFTDKPSPKSVTERTWQMNREDPVAAQQRALEIRREADAVSERVQRSIEAQLQRASMEDMMRMQLAMAYRQNDPSSLDGSDYPLGYFPGIPVGFRAPFNRRPFPINQPSHPPRMSPMHSGPVSSRGSLGNR